jgi:hypothetical protein
VCCLARGDLSIVLQRRTWKKKVITSLCVRVCVYVCVCVCARVCRGIKGPASLDGQESEAVFVPGKIGS